MMEAKELYTDMSDTNDREMSEVMAEEMCSDSGLMGEEIHSEAISNKSEIVAEQNHDHAEIVAEQIHDHAEIVAEQIHSHPNPVRPDNIMSFISDEKPLNELHTTGLIDEDYLMSFFTKTGDCIFYFMLEFGNSV